MLSKPVSLQKLSQLRSPSEMVPLGESLTYQDALTLIEQGGFQTWDAPARIEPFRLRMHWRDHSREAAVRLSEASPRGPLQFECSLCREGSQSAESCPHQWASFVLLWQALSVDPESLLHPEMARLARHLADQGLLARAGAAASGEGGTEWTAIRLDSISLVLDEVPLLKGEPLGAFLPDDFSKYRLTEGGKDPSRFSPKLWNLPEIFRRKITAYSEHYFHEVNTQNRLADLVRYNFSDGTQMSAKEILRHPLYRQVPPEWLPQTKSPEAGLAPWPLLQQGDASFVSHSLTELEEIMRALLDQILLAHRQKKIELFLQTKTPATRALRIESVEFDPSQELDWRVIFSEKKNLVTEVKLVSFRRSELRFFPTFALDVEGRSLLVHPWLREFSHLQETLSKIDPVLLLPEGKMPVFEVEGEFEAKTLLRALRRRPIPVKIEGESRRLPASQSVTEIRLQENGDFYIQHEARVAGQKNLQRRGWSTKSAVFLQTLSNGLPYLLNIEAREVASRSASKRDWDMKLLKHTGILQYIFMEALSTHFEGTRIDGMPSEPETLFAQISDRIQSLLIAGAGGAFVKHMSLADLCSKSVLLCFEDFVSRVFQSLKQEEAFFSEQGEVVLEGIVEREFRLIFEILKDMALSSGGEAFRKSRTPLLSKIASGDPEADPQLRSLTFHLASGDESSRLSRSLEIFQAMVPSGFQIFYKDQVLQELSEDEFRVDFLLQSDPDQRLMNWFELNPKFFLRGEEVDPDQLLRLGAGGVVEYQGRLYLVPQKQMPSLRRLEFFWQKLQKGKVESSRKKNGEKIYQLPRSQTLELLALRSSGVKIRGDDEWKRLCDFYDNLGTKTRDLKLPASMKAELKPYQALGVQWLQDLYHLRLGALLADDMGLGKTLQTLCFLDDLRSKGEMGQTLIVVPSSLIFNWQQEIQKFTPELPVAVFANKEREAIARRLESKEPLAVIATYGLLMEHEDLFNQYKWKVAIFDEAQNLKNITTKRTSSARSLTAQFKICLTGTPMENHYGEFFSIVDLLVPGSLGRIEDFRRRFVNTEMVTREEIEDLKLKIKPLLLRRTKKEILDQLPSKQETKVSIAFEDLQKEIYRDIALSYNRRVQETMATQGEASVQLQMLTALLRLRQACSDPAALPNVRYDKVPPKLETLLDSLREIVESGESALVFTQFLRTLEHTAEILNKAGIAVYTLHGGIPAKQRQKILAAFHEQKGGAVLVMTLKTGGVGLNLTKASYVFHLEPWWNPSVENQATDRAHRLGQTRAVQVFRYIMHESLEEKIELLKERKDRKFQSLFASTESERDLESAGGGLSKDDFDLLLGLK